MRRAVMQLHAQHRGREHEQDLRDEHDPATQGRERLERRSAAERATSATATPAIGHAVQLFATAVNTGVHDVHGVAARGFTGGAAAPPHLAEVQRSFGRHDISGVRAYVGGAAQEASQELGARAYASGNQVAFAREPDLFLVAHELAHVVQQRGGVQLSGGVGAAGDEHETHADAVASLVIRGESAEALLDRYSGAGGGQRVQYQDDPHHPHTARPHAAAPAAPARPPAEVDRLVEDTLSAIAANEVSGAAVAPPSRMGTSSGVPASYGSATQMIASHAIGVLRGAGSDLAAAHGVDEDELAHAHDIDAATRQIWQLLVVEHQPVSAIPPRLRRRVHFSDEQLAEMTAFGRVRDRLLAERPGFPARVAAVRAALEARAAAAEQQLDALVPHEPAADAGAGDAAATPDTGTTDATDATPTTDAAPTTDAGASEETADAPVVDEAALSDVLGSRALSALGPLRGVTPPRGWARWTASRRTQWLARQRQVLARARGRIDDVADRAAASMLAHELASDPDAGSLHLDEADIRAYIHDGDFNRFGEDRAGWIRAGLRGAAEDHPDGDVTRSLDTAIAAPVESGGGWDLSRAEYAAWIRDYITAHPAATDEQVVRAAAAHNGHSSEYPDRIWANYQRLRRPSITAPALTVTLQ